MNGCPTNSDEKSALLYGGLTADGPPPWADEPVAQRTPVHALRADPTLVDDYAALERILAERHTGDREAYTAAKGGFIRTVLDQNPHYRT